MEPNRNFKYDPKKYKYSESILFLERLMTGLYICLQDPSPKDKIMEKLINILPYFIDQVERNAFKDVAEGRVILKKERDDYRVTDKRNENKEPFMVGDRNEMVKYIKKIIDK